LIGILQQLNTLKADLDVQQSMDTKIAALQKELADVESAMKEDVMDAQDYTKAAQELKMMLDQLLAQMTTLETQIGVLSSSIADTTTELRSKVFGLEQTTTAKDDFHWQNARLTKKLKGE
jgi:chromosome segregation ATPase